MTVRVLYVASAARSGSTIFGNALGQVRGCFHGGEISHLWDDGLAADIQCECGRPFSQCPLWNQVVEAIPPGERADPGALLRERDYACRTRYLPWVWMPGGERRLLERMRRFVELTGRVYARLREVTGAEIIVDSSKAPLYAWTLAQLPDLEVRVVHLVRDARAVVFSEGRAKPRPDAPGTLPVHGPVWTTASWLTWNLGTSAVARKQGWPQTRVRYEDFVRDPAAALRAALALFDRGGEGLPFVRDRSLVLQPGHTVSGNPSRYQHGPTELREDDEWRRAMAPLTRRLTTVATWPMLRHYQYD